MKNVWFAPELGIINEWFMEMFQASLWIFHCIVMTRENLCWYAESRFIWRGGEHAPWMKIHYYYKFI